MCCVTTRKKQAYDMSICATPILNAMFVSKAQELGKFKLGADLSSWKINTRKHTVYGCSLIRLNACSNFAQSTFKNLSHVDNEFEWEVAGSLSHVKINSQLFIKWNLGYKLKTLPLQVDFCIYKTGYLQRKKSSLYKCTMWKSINNHHYLVNERTYTFLIICTQNINNKEIVN
jgi:hypothetical protein